MSRKTLLWVIWIGFVAYTLWLAPLDRPYTWHLAKKLLTLQWNDLNAYIPAIFSLMGVWPMIYACLMFVDGQTQPFRVWPYFIGSNFTGVICLLPYLLFRRSNSLICGKPDRWIELLERRSTALSLLLATVGIIAYALLAGDWGDYVYQFQTRHFVHLITLDFCLMGLIFPITSMFEDDMARRGLKQRWMYWTVALIPLFGPLFYLCYRPSLQEWFQASAAQPDQYVRPMVKH